jgi:signal transduction histidine kinase
VVDYDVCASVFLTEGDIPEGVIKAIRPIKEKLLCDIQEDIINSFTNLTGKVISGKGINIKLNLPKKTEQPEVSELRSSFDVPLLVREKALGIIKISSAGDIVYTDEDIRLLYTLANQASSAVERVQAVIAAEKSRLKTVVENMSDGIVMIDQKGQLAVFNPAAREMLGFDKDEIINGLEYLSEIINLEDKTLKTDIRIESPILRILHCEQVTIQDNAKKEIGRLILLRDVTKEREIDKMKSDFVSTVSHELRTPLAAVKVATENMLDGITGEINEIQKECLGIIKRNVDRLSRLISDLLDVSRIESGRLELHRKHIDIKHLIDDVIRLLEVSAQNKGISLATAIDEGVRTKVYADPDRINQVLTNLVGNAIKFTPSGGQVTVEVKRNNRLLEVAVVDTGRGIPPSQLDKVFDKFYQVRQAEGAERSKGTGLGLSISKGIIQAHGGSIRAESQLGKGSKFIFTLPYADNEDLIKAKEENG